jgi:predicted MPP superfamily phosphohydrolase
MSISDSKYNINSRHSQLPPGYRLHALHVAFILSELLGRIPPLLLTPTWVALAVIAGWPWGAKTSFAPAVVVLSLAFTLTDGIGLALLPRRGRSFGPVTPPLLTLAVGRTALALAVGLLWTSPGLSGVAAWPGLLLTVMLNLFATAAFLYATWIEPFHIGVTQAELRSPKLDGHTPLRLLHITDLHIEHITERERKLLRLVEELTPDVVVFTGDYLNLSSVYDPCAQAEAHDLLARLCDITRCPVYAVTGSPPVDRTDIVPAIFADLPITWLQDQGQALHRNGHTIRFIGLHCTRERSLDVPRLRDLLDGKPGQAFTVLLYHSPDLMPEAVELGIDLYLCGHTHGGQVRLPLFGALLTSSAFWKSYEMGRYEEGGTTLYVSRGLGMEGMGAPRARFLSPPEIVLWTLSS